MKKSRLIFLCMIVIILLADISVYAGATYPDIVLNGNPLKFVDDTGYPFVDSYSRTQVPLRASMEAMGCAVEWDEATYSVNISKNNTMVTIPIGEYFIIRNGIKIPNDTCAQIINGRTYLPIRAVYEAFGAYVSWNSVSNCVEVDTSYPLMQIVFIDVGQGDSALVDFGTYEVLIDAGDAKSGTVVVNTIKPYVDGKLELVIATHPDSDHIGGMVDVFDNYTVERVISSGYNTTTKTYQSYTESLIREGCLYGEDSEEFINLDYGAYIKIIETGDLWTTSNDMSVVAELVYGNIKVLFTGDISSKVENATLSQYSDIDVLKVAHHGSAGSSAQSFINVVNPEYAVISAGKNNSYGHPKSDTLARLLSSGVEIFGTFKNGTIVLSLNGCYFNFNKTDLLSLDDAGASEISYVSTGDSGKSFVYVGNCNTKKFHYESCSHALKIEQNNVVKFMQRNDAVTDGYIPCKVCNP